MKRKEGGKKICSLLLEIHEPFLCFHSLFEAQPITAHKRSRSPAATIYNEADQFAYIKAELIYG